MMTRINSAIEQQRAKVAEFSDAVWALENSPKFEPTDNGPLDFLKQQMQALDDETKRQGLLSDAQTSLERSQSILKQMETDWAQQCEAAESKMNELRNDATELNALTITLLNKYDDFTQKCRTASTVIKPVIQGFYSPQCSDFDLTLPYVDLSGDGDRICLRSRSKIELNRIGRQSSAVTASS